MCEHHTKISLLWLWSARCGNFMVLIRHCALLAGDESPLITRCDRLGLLARPVRSDLLSAMVGKLPPTRCITTNERVYKRKRQPTLSVTSFPLASKAGLGLISLRERLVEKARP